MVRLKSLITVLATIGITVVVYSSQQRNPASTPRMGWNSWNWFGKQAINEQIVQEVIDTIVTQGLRDAGYVYVVVDGGLEGHEAQPNGRIGSASCQVSPWHQVASGLCPRARTEVRCAYGSRHARLRRRCGRWTWTR